MKLREEEFYYQYHQHGGTTIIPTEIFNELYDDATEEIERINNIINELEKWIEKERDKWGKYNPDCFVYYQSILDKMEELKGDDKE